MYTISNYYISSANMEILNGVEYTYIYAGGEPIAIHKKTSPTSSEIFYLHLDYQGSLMAISDASGSVVEQRSYDAWGRPRNPSTWTYLLPNPFGSGSITMRGYTMHEHLDMFSLINMNGRLYDPVLCRMLSPDPFIQSPDNTQNYNRYSYCWNNPLKYTDPSGEIIEGLIVGSAGFIVGYTAHGITTGDWGKGALISGGIGAATALVGFYTCGAGLSVNSALTYSGKFAANAVLNNIIPSSNVQIGNVNLSIGIGVGFGANGLSATATSGISVNTKNGSIGVGFGGNNNMLAWKASARIGDYGVNYGKSYYGGEVGPDGIANKQTVGQVGINAGKFSFRIENDFMGDGHDRWRSNAAAVGWGNWELGTNLRNNLQNDGDPVDDFGEDKMGNINKDFKGNRYGKWKNGETYSSPLWLGYKNGNNISRIGYSNPIFQDRTQNWVHKNGFFYAPFGHANFFSNYNQFSSGGYAYSGYNNPYSLW